MHLRPARLGTALLVLALLLALAPAAWTQGKPQVIVYTYDSFASWGPGKFIEERFEAQYDADLVLVAPGDSAEMLSRLIQEQEAGVRRADVFIGLADSDLPRALSRNLFEPYDPARIPNLAGVPDDLMTDPSGHVLPFDHGYVTLVYNKEKLAPDQVPTSFEQLADPRFRRSLIAIDPRTSSPGHAFLLWTIARYGDPGYLEYWERLLPNLLTIAGGWSEAYDMFLNGEAPMVVSYSTDTAYSVLEEGTDRQQVLLLDGEGYRQVEGMGVVRGTAQPELAHAVLNLVLSPEVQSRIPTTNWMFPVSTAAEPDETWSRHAVQPPHPVSIAPEEIQANNARWLREWARVVSR
ncbi:thiamine ABC transporter substrate-binding protein [Limnochorda pilosa]|nr:thiamine ABC transporter substrate-binding protein [Limnochorda pilosa]